MKKIKIIAAISIFILLLFLALATKKVDDRFGSRFYFGNREVLPALSWSPARELSISLYQYEANATKTTGPLQPIKSFTNLGVVYLRYDYVSPEAISGNIKFNDAICKVDKITSFDANGSISDQDSNSVEITYTGPKATIVANFKKSVDTTGRLATSNSTFFFILNAMCYPK